MMPLGGNLSQCHYVHHKFLTDSPWTEPGPSQWEASNWPPESCHGPYWL